jgi:hypothetical protein
MGAVRFLRNGFVRRFFSSDFLNYYITPSGGRHSRGVTASGKRWQAKIRYDSKKHTLGSFDTKQEAALAYDREARQCGKNKPLNYESIAAAEEAAVNAQD